ncbi:MAG: hypothetical protein IJV71_07100 [Lachnospiraceae bacterium]|nr:hypothetical protein [Lachnospiraceae bacterium]
MVELFEQDIRKNERQSSKGNQLKWENNGIWYKADFTGYEGLVEYVISHLLQKSSLSEEEFVVYDLEQIKYRSTVYNGAKSKNFLTDGWQIITLERLFKNFFGESLNRAIYSIDDHKARLKFVVEQVERITGLKDFGIYMGKLFTIDAFFLNEDRHTHNIAVLMNATGEFAYCPIFDNGASLLADTTMDYPLGDDVYDMMKNVKAKTICTSLEEQLDIAEMLYKVDMKFCFNERDINQLLEKATGYGQDAKYRVKAIICAQMRKYSYLFQ